MKYQTMFYKNTTLYKIISQHVIFQITRLTTHTSKPIKHIFPTNTTHRKHFTTKHDIQKIFYTNITHTLNKL